MRFKYEDNGVCGFVRDLENDRLIIDECGIEGRKFMKMAAKLLNEKFEEDDQIQQFENEYNDILDE